MINLPLPVLPMVTDLSLRTLPIPPGTGAVGAPPFVLPAIAAAPTTQACNEASPDRTTNTLLSRSEAVEATPLDPLVAAQFAGLIAPPSPLPPAAMPDRGAADPAPAIVPQPVQQMLPLPDVNAVAPPPMPNSDQAGSAQKPVPATLVIVETDAVEVEVLAPARLPLELPVVAARPLQPPAEGAPPVAGMAAWTIGAGSPSAVSDLQSSKPARPEPGAAPAAATAAGVSPSIALTGAALPFDSFASVPATAAREIIAAPARAEIVDRQLDFAREDLWLGELARDIVTIGNRAEGLSFRLTPQALGRLDVNVAATDKGLSIQMTASSDEARTVIAAAQPRLADEIRSHGVRVADASVAQGGGEERRGERAPEARTPLIEIAPPANDEKPALPDAPARGLFA